MRWLTHRLCLRAADPSQIVTTFTTSEMFGFDGSPRTTSSAETSTVRAGLAGGAEASAGVAG